MRARQHINSLKKNKHGNRLLQFSVNKYGLESFIFEVVQVVAGATKHVRTVEEKYIEKYFDNGKQCYNLKKWTTKKDKAYYSSNPEETKRKIGAASKKLWDENPERKKKMSNRTKELWKNDKYRNRMYSLRKGQTRSDETKKKLSAQKMGDKNPMFGKDFSKEHREKMGIARKGKTLGPKSEETKRKISENRKGKGCHPCSEAKKEKLRRANKGTKPSKLSVERSKEANSKEYNAYLVAPNGERFFLQKNAAEFCKLHGLRTAGLNKLLNRKIKKHNGWILAEL